MSDQTKLEAHGVEVRIEPDEGVVVVSRDGHDLAAVFIYDLANGLDGRIRLGIRLERALDPNEFLIATWVRGEFCRLHEAKMEDVDG